MNDDKKRLVGNVAYAVLAAAIATAAVSWVFYMGGYDFRPDAPGEFRGPGGTYAFTVVLFAVFSALLTIAWREHS